MMALKGQKVKPVPLEAAVHEIKKVPLDSDTIDTARQLGVSLGD
jgi:hypothetical protein